MRAKALKAGRVVISLLFLIFTGFLFLDFAGTFSSSLINGITWIQFVPSLIKFLNLISFLTLGFLVVVAATLLFGRIYCSTVCPLGVLQDVVSWISKQYTRIRGRRVRYRPSPPKNLLRYGLLAITVVTFLSGSIFLLNLLDPFSLFGKIFSGLVRPVYFWMNNMAAWVLQSHDIYTLYDVETRRMTAAPLVFPAFMLGLVVWLSFTRGRLYCNTVCPVGSFLGLLSKKAMYRIEIDDDLCNHCAKCSLNCKAECIDLKNNEVDFSRCVGCFNCLKVCSRQGIDYKNQWFSSGKKKGTDVARNDTEAPPVVGPARDGVHYCGTDRRKFLYHLSGWLAGGTALSSVSATKAAQPNDRRDEVDVEVTRPSTIPEQKNHPVSPPGSVGLDHFRDNCTACQLCVSACPTRVLQPSFLEHGFTGMMQPRMDFHASYCSFDCVICTEICPTGALLPLGMEEKHLSQLGVVRLELDNCVVKAEGTACGACAEHCPTQAVRMVPWQDGLTLPEIHPEHCVGCGGCEYICPTRPYRAIYVDGNQVHAKATPPVFEELDYEEPEEDFPF
ncbi:4Fe-4S dicluster domain-containing protein [Balneolales bacterium ANBcel1]|nr:4Fe-4S dicluster domain-containing protein [Balneolales bacterium ANBcel1]